VQTVDGEPCPECLGQGSLPIELFEKYVQIKFSDILEAKYNGNIFATYKIVDATDSTEYGNLSAANKEAYKMIVSCGVVDLTEGTSIRTKLWSMFGEGTTTRENLEALLE